MNEWMNLIKTPVLDEYVSLSKHDERDFFFFWKPECRWKKIIIKNLLNWLTQSNVWIHEKNDFKTRALISVLRFIRTYVTLRSEENFFYFVLHCRKEIQIISST